MTGMTGMTDDLVPWFRAQLDEDERISLDAPRHDWTILLAGDVETGERTEQRVLDHVMQHHPTRTLRDVEAARRILDIHQPDFGDCVTCFGEEGYDEDSDGNAHRYRDRVPFPCPTVRAAAVSFADREGYREEWRP